MVCTCTCTCSGWEILESNGAICGDDFNWPAVRHDMEKFAVEMSRKKQTNDNNGNYAATKLKSASYNDQNGYLLQVKNWCIFKKQQ